MPESEFILIIIGCIFALIGILELILSFVNDKYWCERIEILLDTAEDQIESNLIIYKSNVEIENQLKNTLTTIDKTLKKLDNKPNTKTQKRVRKRTTKKEN